MKNHLFYGDNLEVLRRYVADESVDLVYLDPPFNSDQSYNVLFKDKSGKRAAAQEQAFKDTWKWDQHTASLYEQTVEKGAGDVSDVLRAFRTFLGESDLMAYIVMMAPRLMELHRTLKPTGSLYLHCDPTASHYLKVLLDAVFTDGMFRSEIIWRRTNSHNKTTTQYGPIHDTILFYSKSNDFVFHPGTRPYSKAYIEDRFKWNDANGRYQLNYLTGPGIRHGESGSLWRGFNPTSAGRHWAIPRSLRKFLANGGDGMGSIDQLESLLAQDLIVFPKKQGGQPMYKQYVGDGVPYQDLWVYQPNTKGVLFDSDECIDQDVKYLEDEDERSEYPTQKPQGLLARILTTSSDPNDVVLDPFCGCGTTVIQAQAMGRRWIGIDITHHSVGHIKQRLLDAYGDDVRTSYEVIGEPTDLEGARSLADQDKFQFQAWALGLVGARTESSNKKGADRGIDGKSIFFDGQGKTQEIIFSVKGGHLKATDLRDLKGVVGREKAAIGVLISMENPTRDMRKEAATGEVYENEWGKYPKWQLLTIEDLLNGKQLERPPVRQLDATFKRAPKARTETASQLRFDEE